MKSLNNPLYQLIGDIFNSEQNWHQFDNFFKNFIRSQEDSSCVITSNYYSIEKSQNPESPYIIKFPFSGQRIITLDCKDYEIVDVHLSVFPSSTRKADFLGSFHQTIMLRQDRKEFKIHLYFSEKGQFSTTEKVILKNDDSTQHSSNREKYALTHSEISFLFRNFYHGAGGPYDFLRSIRLVGEAICHSRTEEREELLNRLAQSQSTSLASSSSFLEDDYLSLIRILELDAFYENILSKYKSLNFNLFKTSFDRSFSEVSASSLLKSKKSKRMLSLQLSLYPLLKNRLQLLNNLLT